MFQTLILLFFTKGNVAAGVNLGSTFGQEGGHVAPVHPLLSRGSRTGRVEPTFGKQKKWVLEILGIFFFNV